MRACRGKEDAETRTTRDKSNLTFATSPGPCFARALQCCPHGFLVFTREGGSPDLLGNIYVIFTISILRRAASRRHSIEGARSSKCAFRLLLASLDRFPSADGMYFHFFPRLLTAVSLPLSSPLRPRCTLARKTRFAGALFETLVSPAGARFTDALFETLVHRPACPSHHTVLRPLAARTACARSFWLSQRPRR